MFVIVIKFIVCAKHFKCYGKQKDSSVLCKPFWSYFKLICIFSTYIYEIKMENTKEEKRGYRQIVQMYYIRYFTIDNNIDYYCYMIMK